MSNLIKYPFVNMQGKESVVIGYEKETNFIPFKNNNRVLVRPAEEVEAERALQKKMKEQAENRKREEEKKKDSSGFVESVPVVNMDALLAEREEQARKEAEKIIENARVQADFILSEAKEQVELLREQAHAEGVREGYEEGTARAEEEFQQKWQEFNEEKISHEAEYQELLREVEPQYVEILCSLIHKITGVIVSDRKDVFLHLIRSNIGEVESAGKYTIRVSPDDIVYVESHKEDIVLQLGSDVTLDIQEEKGLRKNDCIIETDTQMIDCGLQTQLSNLVSTLRMLL